MQKQNRGQNHPKLPRTNNIINVTKELKKEKKTLEMLLQFLHLEKTKYIPRGSIKPGHMTWLDVFFYVYLLINLFLMYFIVSSSSNICNRHHL